ncbi:MAG: hypothetical protein M1834_009094 [Cirrosporium novae-zelandiae]|nr:MAG: hypothetical protein M1834_009094 [Cirrosporium novae-zelandiae]
MAGSMRLTTSRIALHLSLLSGVITRIGAKHNRSAYFQTCNFTPSTKALESLQTAKDRNLHISSDERLPEDIRKFYKVYIDHNNKIWDVTLVLVIRSKNINTNYHLQVLVSKNYPYRYAPTASWGKIGWRRQGKRFGDGTFHHAIQIFDEKLNAYLTNSYARQQEDDRHIIRAPLRSALILERAFESSLESKEESANSPTGTRIQYPTNLFKTYRMESTLPESVQRLMKLIFSVDSFLSAITSMGLDTNKLLKLIEYPKHVNSLLTTLDQIGLNKESDRKVFPLGKLSKKTVEAGLNLLKDMNELLSG